MCWSFGNSVFFASCQVIAMALLFYRNKEYDRLYALCAFPVMAQEWCQAMLWLHVDDAQEGQCSSANAFWGRMAMVFSCSVGITFTYFLWRIEGGKSWRRVLFFVVLVCTILGYAVFQVWSWLYSKDTEVCTWIGKCQHLTWPPHDAPQWAAFLWQNTYFGSLAICAVFGYENDGRGGGHWIPYGVATIGVGSLALQISIMVHFQGCALSEAMACW